MRNKPVYMTKADWEDLLGIENAWKPGQISKMLEPFCEKTGKSVVGLIRNGIAHKFIQSRLITFVTYHGKVTYRCYEYIW